MDYKEKYEQALKTAKLLADNTDDEICKKKIEAIFPELRESEDEMIRIELLEYLKLRLNCPLTDKQTELINKSITWLEKQKEQKSADTPKFKVGDWITNNCAVWCIESIHNGLYNLKGQNGGVISNSNPKAIDNEFHLWTIKDAKDGDMLKEDSCTFIVERMKPDGTAIVHCCLFKDGDFDLGSNLSFDVNSTYPATKEQRDLLFQKMEESGYEWDAEKKELRKIEQKPSTSVTEFDAEVERFCKEYFITDINEKGKVFCIARHFVDWQKNRKNPAWSEEDDRMLKSLKALLNEASCYSCTEGVDKILSWFKSLKNRVTKLDWSDEDIVAIDCAIDFLRKEELGSLAASLERIKYLKTWKPTKAQMDDFYMVLMEYGDRLNAKQSPSYQSVKYIYEDLKKL